MIVLFQLAIVLFAGFIIVVSLGSRSTHSGRAWKKMALVLLAVAMIIGVMFPGLTNDFAHIVGVGRGADLLLYATVVAFIGYVLNAYLHQQDQRDILYRLARKVAIIEANERYGIK
jgi:hypothetical protein